MTKPPKKTHKTGADIHHKNAHRPGESRGPFTLGKVSPIVKGVQAIAGGAREEQDTKVTSVDAPLRGPDASHLTLDADRLSIPESASGRILHDELVGHGLKRNDDLSTLLTGLLTDLPIFVCVLNQRHTLEYANSRFAYFEGVNAAYKHQKNFDALFPVGLSERIDDLVVSDDYEQAQGVDICIKHKDKVMHTYHVVKLRRFLTGEQPWYIVVGVDVTAHYQAKHALLDHQSRLDYMIYHDPLTGLANRALFYDQISKVLTRAQHEDDNFALLLVDIDRFKNINDSLGHDAGDVLLKMVADILSEELRDTDSVARLGGDEFVVVLERVHSVANVEQIATRILQKLALPVSLRGHEITSTASIGICFYPRDGDSIDALLKHADIAMYRAKCAGKNRYEFFLNDMQSSLVDSLLLENELRRAIIQQEMHLHYQPQIDIRTGRIIGLEALVRWQHKERGMISPMDFIPLAEDTGLIGALGEWVLNHACERFQAWLMAGLNFGKIAVNLSAKQFRMERFEQTVVKALTHTHLAPQYLELEITESSAMENAEEAINMLNCLNQLGLSLAIDDFGTGYSSLAYLRRFPINKLKIDRSFVNDINEDGEDAAIAKSIIDLAHNLKLEVLAEGVEQLDQAHWLLARGCMQVQGFYYSKPLSEEQLLDLVNSEKAVRDSLGIRLVL
ncbi:putative bifunctional diguanylate cyclase/phosphodiesterase [Marinagarivorans algicola]|uniref:putative bifunctional diguanylate cyclase/phosphodiesterase n=1 Tax=Marinagarivorans algicola TaxID=1513270 RepID=UPI0006B9B814|nr:EAL domain-containing protein [Marinagarivorans algicola]